MLGRQLAEIDGDQDARSFPHGESRRDQPGLDHSAGHIEVFKHLQGAGVHGCRPGGVLALRQLVNHDRPVPPGDQGGGHGEAGGAGAYHQDVGVVHGWLPSVELVNACWHDSSLARSARDVNTCWPTIVDMRRSSDQTKAVILAAARERFGAVGFQAATIRAIAADAGVDPAMVMRYYTSKDKLFAAAAEFDLKFPDFAGTDRQQVGRALVRHFLERWEGDEALVILLRSSATNGEAGQRMQEIFGTQLQPLVASFVPASEAGVRAGLIATQILGMALCRFVLRLPPVVEMTMDEVVEWIGPTIQRYLGLPEV